MFLKMLFNQARRKWLMTAMVWLAMTSLVSLYIYSANSAKFNNRSMQLIMKDMGHNQIMLPRTADPIQAYTCGEGQTLFPEAVTDEMAKCLALKSKYYVAVLQHRIERNSRVLLLTGMRPVPRADETKEKGNLLKPVKPGTARLGAEAARVLEVKTGETFPLQGREFRVDEIVPAAGTQNDYRVYVDLHDAQTMYGQDGSINVIWCFLCMHGKTLPKIMADHDERMEKEFPDYVTITAMNIAHARDVARRTTSGYLANFVRLVAVITMLIIGITGVQEVTERRRELGVMLAMGSGYLYIAALYLVKVIFMAVVASVVGFLVGSYLSKDLMGGLLETNTRPVGFIWSQLPDLALKTCIVVTIAALAPVVKMLMMDPNAILAEE